MSEDPSRERLQLQQRYAAMSDGEVLRIAKDLDALTDVAREVLLAELSKRGLNPGDEIEQEPVAVAPEPMVPAERVAGFFRRWMEARLRARAAKEAQPDIMEDVVPSSLAALPAESELVTATRLLNLPGALILRGALRSAEIDCIVCDAEFVRLNWLWSNLIGWLRVQVPTSELADAIAIMREPIPERFEVPDVGEYEQPACPKCNSLDVNFQENSPIAYGTLYLNFPLPVVRAAWRCHACRYQWKTDDA